jgi:hypothetical protein
MDQDTKAEEKILSLSKDKKFTSEVMTLKFRFSMNWKESTVFLQRQEELHFLVYLQVAWLS